MSEPEAVVEFWLHEVGVDGWYEAIDDVDEEIRKRFGAEWQAANAGQREFWCNGPRGTLAYLILTDQFPRNMFRGRPEAFATDARARTAAAAAIDRGFDLKIPEPERVFFYMPFEHSEDLADQDWCIALFESRLDKTRDEFLLHGRTHREIIRRFGRFPYRNAALGRQSTAEEVEFLENGGYRAILNELAGA
ncbi:DUF924 family protein [Defluviimonas salinarum]|uniref:DUF924 domain-containing protein n=1 Tax=Defluviimonas salinarum TaxID=2992147 RepID=A0ABT3IZE1_9RHOB|nr:DUF924 family protein [Defluviimonas salinarum]MCW3780806.1 DUF924 domain-containing protein [Defluviimonas salinarum]